MSLKNFRSMRPKSRSVLFGTFRDKGRDSDSFDASKFNNNTSEYFQCSKPTKLSSEFPSLSVTFWEIPGVVSHFTKFFLKSDVIYFVVYNLEELELVDIDFWMNCIKESRNPDSLSPIFLIGTHSDNPLCTNEHISVVLETLQDRYSIGIYKGLHKDNFFVVNCTNLSSVSDLRTRVCQLIQNPKFSDKLFPKMINSVWLIFRELIRNLESTYMTKEDIIHAMHACSIPRSELNSCIQFLQSCDNILYFDLASKGCLLILDIFWWIDIISRMVSPDNPYQKDGIMQLDDIANYLSECSPTFISYLIIVLEEEYIASRLKDDLMVRTFLFFLNYK